jgi:hypothetical protein
MNKRLDMKEKMTSLDHIFFHGVDNNNTIISFRLGHGPISFENTIILSWLLYTYS